MCLYIIYLIYSGSLTLGSYKKVSLHLRKSDFWNPNVKEVIQEILYIYIEKYIGKRILYAHNSIVIIYSVLTQIRYHGLTLKQLNE